MEETSNKPIEPQAKDMDNSLRDDSKAIDSIPEELIKKGGNVLVNSGTESLELELPSGVKISLSSGNKSVEELCGLSVWLLEKVKQVKGNGNTGGYIN